jgi:hypothetical protein
MREHDVDLTFEPAQQGAQAGKMAHKFKIGQIVHYRPADRGNRAAIGTYAVTARLPEIEGQPAYRIKHFNEVHERIAQESELTAV